MRKQPSGFSACFAGLIGLLAWLGAATTYAQVEKPQIVLRSGWQLVNIGDIAHSPGVLALLEKHIPEAEVHYWPVSTSPEVKAMLARRFPHLVVEEHPKLKSKQALPGFLQSADLLLHGSGPSLVAAADMQVFEQLSNRPWGPYGITVTSSQLEILGQADFIFTRETKSLDVLRDGGIEQVPMAFVPDGVFALDVRDDQAATAFMREHDLAAKQFACFVPRLRYTPYHTIRANQAGWTQEKIQSVEAHNAATREMDHAKMRAAIIRYVRETGHTAVLVPEMTYQVDIMQELLIDPLPDDVRQKVVRHDYRMPDAVRSLYGQAQAVVSFECHSPIMAFSIGTPGIYLRQPEDTIKGQMWYDIGVDEWVHEIDVTSGAQAAAALMKIIDQPDWANAYLAAAMQRVDQRHRDSLASLRQRLQLD